MDIILLQDIDKVGDKHTVVTVKDGYGRNYLIPQKMAIIANDSNLRRLDELKRRESAMEERMLSTYKEQAATLASKTLKIGAKAGSNGKIFGSVTAIQAAKEIKEQFGIEINRKKIVIPAEAIELGTFTMELNFHKDVQGTLNFEIVEE